MDKPIKKNINGIDVYYIKSSKFKTITWSFVFTHPSGTRRINEYYFLSNILVDNMKKYPTFVKKYRYLASLYGLDAFSSCTTIGSNIVNQFVVTYPNEIYIEGEQELSVKAFEFLMEVIQNPKLREGKFPKKVVKDQFDEAKQSFKILKADKDMYAYYRFSKIYYQDKPDLLYNFPENERLDEVSLDSLMETYDDLFSRDKLSLYVTGNIDIDKFDQIIQNNLPKRFQSIPHLTTNKAFPYQKDYQAKVVREFDDVKQARIFIGFNTDVQYYSELHPALGVMNDIFGGFDQSKLFLDIREKHRLAYFVNSFYQPDEQMLVVMIISDFIDENILIAKVKQALQEVIDGDFSDELLKQAKTNAIHSVSSIIDSQPIYLMQHIKSFHLFDRKYNLEERIKAYKRITREDIIKAAKTLVLDTVYVSTKAGDPDA